MTGFGSASLEGPELEATATVRSVNHRFLDLSVHVSRRLLPLEPEVRRAVQLRLQRGKVEVSLQARSAAAGGDAVRAAPAFVASLASVLRELKEAHRLAGDVTVSDVARFPGAIEVVEPPPSAWEEARGPLLDLLGQALDQVEAMRAAEGEHLRGELAACLDQVLGAAGRIEALAAEGRAERIASLLERVRELAAAAGVDDARLPQELVRLVDRSDVDEELARLRSHVAQCREAIQAATPCGKRLDFLAQELAREGNTIGSKAVSAAVVHEVVVLKAVIERFREQVQNVE